MRRGCAAVSRTILCGLRWSLECSAVYCPAATAARFMYSGTVVLCKDKLRPDRQPARRLSADERWQRRNRSPQTVKDAQERRFEAERYCNEEFNIELRDVGERLVARAQQIVRRVRSPVELLETCEVDVQGQKRPIAQLCVITKSSPSELTITPLMPGFLGPIMARISKIDSAMLVTRSGDKLAVRLPECTKDRMDFALAELRAVIRDIAESVNAVRNRGISYLKDMRIDDSLLSEVTGILFEESKNFASQLDEEISGLELALMMEVDEVDNSDMSAEGEKMQDVELQDHTSKAQ